MIIRPATIKDSNCIARYLLLAMEDIVYRFIDEVNLQKAEDFLVNFTRRENNQYSFQNCLVAEDNDGEVAGAVNIYDGSRLNELRQPVIQFVRARFNPDFNPGDETQPGEFYIDSLGVNPDKQDRGIGTRMLQYLISEYVDRNQQTLGLLVEEDNQKARGLYYKLGFRPVGQKLLMKKTLDHLQLCGIRRPLF